MFSAIVLVNTEKDSQDKALKNLKIIDGVEEAHALYGGVYDLIVKVKASSIDKLKNITRLGIRQVESVTSSLTLMLVEEPVQRMRMFEDLVTKAQNQGNFEPMLEVQQFVTPTQ